MTLPRLKPDTTYVWWLRPTFPEDGTAAISATFTIGSAMATATERWEGASLSLAPQLSADGQADQSDQRTREARDDTMTRNVAVILLLAAATIGCDRVSKHIAVSHLADAPRQSFLGDTVRLEYVENTGAFLGLGADWPAALRGLLFTIGNAALLAATVVVAIRRRWSGLAAIGVALFASGGLSNLIDRATRGSVPDFINLGMGPLRTGIFNVADVAIMLGVAFVAFGTGTSQGVTGNGQQT